MAVNSFDDLIPELKSLIAEGEAQQALVKLESYAATEIPSFQNEVTLLMARHNQLQRDVRLGVVTRETGTASQTQLTIAILNLIDEIRRKIALRSSPVQAPSMRMEAVVLPPKVGLETILGVNNLKQISWIAHGLEVSQSICRILTPSGLGTGFLIAPNLLMTNNHVIRTKASADDSVIEFNYQADLQGNKSLAYRYRLDTSRFYTSSELDYTIVGVKEDADRPELKRWGVLSLSPFADPVVAEHVVIIQHPNGGLKQIALTANQVIGSWEHRLHYTTDTMPGSSGAPVFNDVWQVIAIHHAGGNLQINAQGDKRYLNEGILMSAIRKDAGVYWPVDNTGLSTI